MPGLLVRGGTVVDGTGAPARPADVRIRDGRIAEIGIALDPDGERVIDAEGAYVAPGIVDTHTHLDGAMFWDPSVDPLPVYGNTTVVFGNCGNSIAPSSGAQREEIVDLLCFLEDLPVDAFRHELPWTWEHWPEYAAALGSRPVACNVGGYLGHVTLRTYVMGEAAWERTATADERARMAALLDDALASGAMGLSVNHFDRDRALRLVPGYFADDAEYHELLAVLARYPGRTFQVITRFNDPDHHVADAERFARLCAAHGVRGQYPGIRTDVLTPEENRETWALHRRLRDEGLDFWPVVPYKPLEPFFSFERSIVFQRIPAWNQMINGPADAKLTTLADPAWRDRARREWDDRPHHPAARVDRPESLIFSISETGVGPIGVSLADYARANGWHVSDALAEWLLANGIGSLIVGTPDALDEDLVLRGLREPNALTNVNDSGAHLQLFCGAGQNVYLLTHYVRDEGLLSLEHAVHLLTGRPATFFGLTDRGRVAPGLVADLVVFALDEIELRPEIRSYDVPFGSWRLTRPPAGFRTVLVGGVPTVADGAPTGSLPGRPVAPS